MPCYVCNPACGKCRPERARAIVVCPECGKSTMRLAAADGISRCVHCGASLEDAAGPLGQPRRLEVG